MKHVVIAGALLAAALVPSCGPRRYSGPEDVDAGARERSEAKYMHVAATGEDWCDYCNLKVFGGHRCGRTVPCRMCRREQGAGHVHAVIRNCEPCNWLQVDQHICNDSKNCDQCRTDSRGPIGERPCRRCYRSLKADKIEGVTTYCHGCNYEVGPNHVCGKSQMCTTCWRESGKNHIHDATRLCGECGFEAAIDHTHGTTSYCRDCQRDAGPGHVHGRTVWCYTCNDEKEWPHHWHK